MKFIRSNAGTAAIKVSADDVTPRHGVLGRELINFVAAEYQFAVSPQLPPGMPAAALGAHVHQSGLFTDDDGERYPIVQMSVVGNGHIVTAATTDIAEKILNHFMKRLDTEMGFRFSVSPKKTLFHSQVVCQIEPSMEDRLKDLSIIEALLNQRIPRPDLPFKIKRLAFGGGDSNPLFMPTSMEAIETADFIMERRAGEPYGENRYFSSAPLTTSDHLTLLEAFEQAFR
jgi:hypothetical protein